MSYLEPLQGEPGKSGDLVHKKTPSDHFLRSVMKQFFYTDKAQIPLSNRKKEGSKLV